jgi:anhydro-N-acetylmuramic acid kinase
VLALNQTGADELARAAYTGAAIARSYARVTQGLLSQSKLDATDIAAIGAHGQTVRHRPGAAAASPVGTSPMASNTPVDPSGYTLQLLNGALLAELTGIDVVCDLRSRDVAAGGQGAPLVPALHQALFSKPNLDVAVLNLGGIGNLSLLPSTQRQAAGAAVLGFDCGPGNALLDAWCERHGHGRFDNFGQWAAGGSLCSPLLAQMLAEPYFAQPPPKSTGRDLFDQPWLDRHLHAAAHKGLRLAAQDVQATLTELTAQTAAQALQLYSPNCAELLVCGGGALNHFLMQRIRDQLPPTLHVRSTAELGLPVDQVEALAFAWLARARVRREAGNLPAVTGAAGPRILGAVFAGR